MLEMYDYTKKALEDIRFTEEDLRSYIHAKANRDRDETNMAALALHTGHLLNILTERNRHENTRFYMNGYGADLAGLFGFSNKIDALYLENFKGGGLCAAAGCFSGNANIMIAKNIKGNALFAGIGSYNGNAGLVIAKDIEGDELLADIDNTGGVNKIGLVIAHNIKGNRTFENLGKGGKIGMIIGKNIQGINVLHELRFRANVISGTNIQLEKDFFTKRCKVPKNSTLVSGAASECTEDEEGYQKCLEEYKINEINELVESMDNKTPEEVFDIAEKIQGIYNSIRSKVENV